MSSLPPKAIEEFKQLYKKQYGEDIPDDIASEAANKLVHMMSLVYRPILKSDEAKYRQIEKEQGQVKEEDKTDYVKRLVDDACYADWRNIISPTKRHFIKFYRRFPITLSDGQQVGVPVYAMKFKQWQGEPPANTYGGKQIVDFDGKPLFAELAVLELLKKERWSGVWVDSYGKKFRTGLPDVAEPITLPDEQKELLERIAGKVGRFAGCWDVFAWHKNEVLFAECKRIKKDAIRQSQIKWLEACLSLDIPLENFLMVEWDI
jgi:hypothetical protein